MRFPEDPLTKSELAAKAEANSDAALLRDIDRLVGEIAGIAGRLSAASKRRIILSEAGKLRAFIRAVPAR